MLSYFEKLHSGNLNEAQIARERYLAVRAAKREESQSAVARTETHVVACPLLNSSLMLIAVPCVDR